MYLYKKAREKRQRQDSNLCPQSGSDDRVFESDSLTTLTRCHRTDKYSKFTYLVKGRSFRYLNSSIKFRLQSNCSLSIVASLNIIFKLPFSSFAVARRNPNTLCKYECNGEHLFYLHSNFKLTRNQTRCTHELLMLRDWKGEFQRNNDLTRTRNSFMHQPLGKPAII